MKQDFEKILEYAKSIIDIRLMHILLQHESETAFGISYLYFADSQTPFVKYVRRKGIGKPHESGWRIDSDQFSISVNQNNFVKQEICSLVRDVLAEYGIICTVYSEST